MAKEYGRTQVQTPARGGGPLVPSRHNLRANLFDYASSTILAAILAEEEGCISHEAHVRKADFRFSQDEGRNARREVPVEAPEGVPRGSAGGPAEAP